MVFSSSVLGTAVLASNIDSTYKYSWGENIGWMNWAPTYNGTEYGVTVYTECLTGYIWGENVGWIKLGDNSCTGNDCCQTGTSYGYENDSNSTDDDGDGVVDDWGVNNNISGILSGYAWGENIGWINFKDASGNNYHGARIDTNGNFSNYAWGENVGWINMNCSNNDSCNTVDFKVKTSWSSAVTPSSPIYGSAFIGLTPPTGGFSIVINDDAEETDSRDVTLTLNGGPDAVDVMISNFSNFQDGIKKDYETTKTWTLTECEGVKTVFVKFYNLLGMSSDITSDSITLVAPSPLSPLSPEAQQVDVNQDSKIDILDFNLVMINWGVVTEGNIADLNDDNMVGIFDFNLLMIHWS